MSRRYDQSTTTFSPEGRLHQVEYAIEAINSAGTCLALLVEDGIVLAAEKRVVSTLLSPCKTNEKTHVVDNHVVTLIAGLTSDANTLLEHSRITCQRHRYRFQQPMPVEMVVKEICDYKHSYTQYGGLRPFGTTFLTAGWDVHHGFQIYQTDPSGNFSGWKATVIGQNNQAGKNILKTDYKPEGGINEALKTAIRVLIKTMDATSPSSERVELSVLRRDSTTGEIYHHFISDDEVTTLISQIQKELDAEQKKAEATIADI